MLQPTLQPRHVPGNTLRDLDHAAFLILRGLKTYFVRYQAQCASAMRIAETLAAHPAVARVHYPGLPTHPQHALASAQMRDFGTIGCSLGGSGGGVVFPNSPMSSTMCTLLDRQAPRLFDLRAPP